MHHGDFAPLACNIAIEEPSTPCESFSSKQYDLMGATVVVPCGTCLTMDLVGDRTFAKGLDVQGKLVFPADRSALKITTPFVFVQGVFVVEELHESRIPQVDRDLEFRFVGTDDVSFVSHPDQVFDKCENGCSLSKKPFAVAGGRVDIRGMSDNCHTWTRVLAAEDAGSATIAPVQPPLPAPECDRVLVAEDFDVTNTSDLSRPWDGRGARSSGVTTDGYFTVSNRTGTTQGPRVDLPVNCIAPNEPYTIRFQFRYRHASSSKSAFAMPRLNLIRTKAGGGSDWIGVDEVYGRGETSAVPVDEWQSLESTIMFDASMADPSYTSDLALYVAPYDDADAIDLDDFVLELVPSAAFDGRSCDSLLRESTGNSPVAYPWHSTGGSTTVLRDGDGPGGQNDSSYLRNKLRKSIWSSPFSHDLPVECLVKAAVYEFEAAVRVHASTPSVVSVALVLDGNEHAIVVCPPSAGDWVVCSGRIRLEEDHAGASEGSLRTRVLGEDTPDVDLANARLDYRGGRAHSIVPEQLAGIADCWAPGAEILITSHTILQEDAQVATIAFVDATTGAIVLEEPIHAPITIGDDPRTAVEVALLTRNIRFTAADDDASDPLHGGHFIVMHTPAPTVQTLIGIESHGFGQQGKLGRYPFHFHMCGSVAGSVLSKNSVRNTKQRGIVVHGSNDLYLEENILHNIRGHGYMLEDGAEQGNVFFKNLGAVSNPVDIRISDAESDNAPSTFWITNPQNTYIGNVAAGSQMSGFWFEVNGRVRGPSAAMHPDMVPNKLDLLEFVDNVSHSSARGLQTYPQAGYRPERLAVFQNHGSYRNRISGVFFHAGGRLSIDGGYLSDNPIGVDIDMDHSDVISNTVVVGLSQAYQAVLDDLGAEADRWPQRGLCSQSQSLVGIRLDSFHDGSLFGATGTSVKGTSFAGFGTRSCPRSAALHVDGEDIQYFDTRNNLESVTIEDDSPLINLCDGEEQVAIRYDDMSVEGSQQGFLISDTPAIRAHPDCVSLPGTICAAVCPDTCLRTMTVMIPSTSTYARGALSLRVSGNLSDGRPIVPIEIQDFQTKESQTPDAEYSRGRFFATLPAGGSYTARFVDTATGAVTWPVFTDLRYEDAVGSCGPDFTSFEIETSFQERTHCVQLVQNGDFKAGNFEHWRYAGHYGLEVVNGGAGGSAYSLKTPNAEGGGWVGPGQYLDTRCIEEGYIYTITANVRLTDSTTGAVVGCNLDAYTNANNSCPRATFRFTNQLDDPQHHWQTFGVMETADQEWNTLSGSYVATEYAGAAHAVYVYITGVRKGIDIQIDDVEILRSEATQEPTSAPTEAPSSVPSGAPTEQVVTPDEEQSLFEGSSATSVFFDDDGSIRLQSTSQEPSTVMSTLAHTNDANGGDLELVVTVPDRDFTTSGWQPSIVLFFAPGSTTIEDVTTPDNGFHNFEGTVVATVNHRMFPTLGSYFRSKAKQVDGTFVGASAYERTLPLPTIGTVLKLSRSSEGRIRSFYSLDSGATWTQIDGEYLLAPDYRDAPLKVGYRLYLEYKTSYRVETIPSLTSGGEVLVAPPAPPQSFFDGTNADLDSVSCTPEDGCRVWGHRNVAKLLSHETFEGDVIFVSELTNRPMFGTAYQSGLWLFLAPADATLNSIPNSDGAFRDYSLGTVGDKIYAPSDHTYVYSSSMGAGGSSVDQYLGQRWKNVAGYTKLQRIGGRIGAYVSPNGHTWTQVGNEIELSPELANVAVKLGYRVAKNWAPGYEFQVLSTVSSVAQTEIIV